MSDIEVMEENRTETQPIAPDTNIELHSPKIFKVPISEETQETKEFFNKDVAIRFARWSFFALMPVIFLFILTHNNTIDLCVLIGIAIEVMYICYFSIVGFLFYTGSRQSKNRYLFRIWTRSEQVKEWANMKIATHQQLHEFKAIQSISEFSAVEGGVPSFMLSNLGPFTWAVVTMHFASELQYNGDVFSWDIADYLEIIGVCGLVMIGIFELDPYNSSMKFFHYVGAGTGVGTIGGMIIQAISLSKAKNNIVYLVLPIIITLIAGVCFMLWRWSNKMTDKYQNDIENKYKISELKTIKISADALKTIKAKITKLSLQNVIFEGIFLFMGATSLAVWLGNYHQSCKFGCAGEYEP